MGGERLAKAYGLDWADVGFMIEDQHAPKLSIHHIQLCAYVHRSMKRVQSGKYKHIKRSRVPINETDLHLATEWIVKTLNTFTNIILNLNQQRTSISL